jgi:cytochrome c551/c552
MAELPKINNDGLENKLDNLIEQNMAGFELVAGFAEKTMLVNSIMLSNQERWMQTQREQYLSEVSSAEEARREQSRLLGQVMIGADSNSGTPQLEKKPDASGDGSGLISAVAGSMGVAWTAVKGGGLFSKIKGAFNSAKASINTVGPAIDDAAKAGNATAKSASKLGKFLKGGNIVAAVALNVKDAVDIGMAALDNDINTEVQNADIGGVLGGAIGGGLGFVLGGPAGAALGASLGNMVGEHIGESFDPDAMAKNVADGLLVADQELVKKYELLESSKKHLSEEQYQTQKALLDSEKALLIEKAEDFNKTKVLLEEERKLAGDKYNDYAKFLEEQEAMGMAVSEEQRGHLLQLESTFEQSSDRYAKAIDDMKGRLSQGELLDQVEDSGFYDKDWIGNSEIDKSKAANASAGQIKAILDDADVSDKDRNYLQNLLIEKMKMTKEERESSQNKHLEMQHNATSFLETSKKAKMPSNISQLNKLEKAEDSMNPSGSGAGGAVDNASRAINSVSSISQSSINAPITNVDNSQSSIVNQTSVASIPPTPRKNKRWGYAPKAYA